MVDRKAEYGLEFLHAFDGRIHHLEQGYWLKFAIRRVEVTKERPHGLSYAFTLHAPYGARLVGFDNAHGAAARRSGVRVGPPASDHWHRTEHDPGRPYLFKDAETLIEDFFSEVERVLGERGIGTGVVDVEEARRSR